MSELVDALGSWEGAEKVIGPFLAILVKRHVYLYDFSFRA